MMIELSYWDIEEAVIDLLKKRYTLELESDQIQGSFVETTKTTYPYKKDENGEEVFDRSKPTHKKKQLDFDGQSEISFYIEPKSSEK